jgi:hypothetical protein
MTMHTVTQRQRFLATLAGVETDRFPFFDLAPDEETLRGWRREGLPHNRSVATHFNLETHHAVGLTLRSYPFFRKASDLLTDPSAFDRHYHPEQRSRFASGYVQKCERLRQQGKVYYVDASGGGLLQMLGVGDWESLRSACFAMCRQPRRVEDLVEKTSDFHCACL